MIAPLDFRISSYCCPGTCVAVAAMPDGGVAVRDTKVQDGPVLLFTAEEWDSFIAGAREGQFDRSALVSPEAALTART